LNKTTKFKGLKYGLKTLK